MFYFYIANYIILYNAQIYIHYNSFILVALYIGVLVVFTPDERTRLKGY